MSFEEYLQHVEDCKPREKEKKEILEHKKDEGDGSEDEKSEENRVSKVLYRDVKKEDKAKEHKDKGEENRRVEEEKEKKKKREEEKREEGKGTEKDQPVELESWTAISEHPFAITVRSRCCSDMSDEDGIVRTA